MRTFEDEILAELNATPLAELRRRAAVVTDLSWTDASYAQEVESYRFGGATRYATNDSGGQAVQWYFADDGKALLLTFEHEGDLNRVHPLTGFELQRRYYQGLPDDLLRLAADPTDAYENQWVRDPRTGAKLLYATGIAWFDGGTWRVADGLAAYCVAEGVDPAEAGFGLLSPYLLGREFTPETYLDDYFLYDGWDGPDRAALLDQVRPIFARYG